jgi:hypothetical protein
LRVFSALGLTLIGLGPLPGIRFLYLFRRRPTATCSR